MPRLKRQTALEGRLTGQMFLIQIYHQSSQMFALEQLDALAVKPHFVQIGTLSWCNIFQIHSKNHKGLSIADIQGPNHIYLRKLHCAFLLQAQQTQFITFIP